MKIDLLYLSFLQSDLNWSLGDVYFLGTNLFEADSKLNEYIAKSKADYILTINIDHFALPLETDIIEIVNSKPGELWHLGLKCNFQSLPKILDYIYPVWLYTLDAPQEVSSTSWRISAECFLANRDVLLRTFIFDRHFDSIAISGLDWGFRLLKAGVIIRYEPTLSNILEINSDYNQITISDEMKFVKRNFSTKWFFWSCYRLYINGHSFFNILRGYINNFDTTKIPVKTISRITKCNSVDVLNSKVSIFTPTLQRYSYLASELKQLRKQTIKPFEIFITDQTDIDKRDVEWLSDFNDLNIIYQPQEEKGQCKAWNYCLENSTGDYVLFLGDDADDIGEKFIEDLLNTMFFFKADMVACNIKEQDNDYPYSQNNVFVSDIFPICIVKKSIFSKIGGYDYAYNKGSRADGDVAVRMNLNGALMILNPNIKIYHHRAPVGGLRSHGQRIITRNMSKKSIYHFQLPSFSEIYLSRRYFSKQQQNEMFSIKNLSLISIDGNPLKKILKFIIFLLKRHTLNKELTATKNRAEQLQNYFPKIPKIK